MCAVLPTREKDTFPILSDRHDRDDRINCGCSQSLTIRLKLAVFFPLALSSNIKSELCKKQSKVLYDLSLRYLN